MLVIPADGSMRDYLVADNKVSSVLVTFFHLNAHPRSAKLINRFLF